MAGARGEPRHIDELACSLGAASGTVSAVLAMLELKGLARQVGAMLYTVENVAPRQRGRGPF
jgi:predicted Rossmann fold nucleotide-binding protein DprA/Smf involved in DNA uptake